MAQSTPTFVAMNNLGSPASASSVTPTQQKFKSSTAGLTSGNFPAQAVAPCPQGQPSAIPGTIPSKAVVQGQRPSQPVQQSLQAQGQPLNAQSIVYQVVQCGCLPGNPCSQHTPVPNPNPIVRCVKFLACWDCGPIGATIAILTFAVGTVISYFGIKLAIWTATKDYIEHCQADEEAQRATSQCKKAAGQALPPPPFFEYDPTNNTVVRRTLGGMLLGSTESISHNNNYVWAYALLYCTFCWMVLSATCYVTWSLLRTRRISAGYSGKIVASSSNEAWRPSSISDPNRRIIPLRRTPCLPAIEISCAGSDSGYCSRPIESHKITRASSSAIIANEDNASSVRRRGKNRVTWNQKSRFSLLEENESCRMGKDEELIRKSLVSRGATFPMKLKPHLNMEIEKLACFGDKNASIDQPCPETENLSKKQRRLHELVHRDIRDLLGLYGLEISACTGNSRRISLIDMLFIPPLKGIFTSFPWMSSTLRRAITRIVNGKDAEVFVKFYMESPAWLEEIKKAIAVCLDLLKLTGIDSGGNLVALYHSQGGLTTVEFPREFYSWGNILRDTAGNFTVAVVTDTCLSSRSPLQGKRCRSGAHNDEDSVTLATQISISAGNPGSSIRGFSLTASRPGEKHWTVDAGAADQRLIFMNEGYLNVKEPILELRDHNFPKVLAADWTASLIPTFCHSNPDLHEPTFVECPSGIDEKDGIRPITTYIFGRTLKEFRRLKRNKDE
ncbi:a154ffdb-3294-48b1-bca9-157b7aa95ad0 [Sclerotinia trifoliorum]|uniref:A154ffdb-3294-48b1-bca9-157b7aa95ad0 n=1 Tax=Sclerotinia trifoliorum TaxID=28548 RepID=A0A8H2W751_9HELO|nr:a154ffdb-3294-48b1-bca9-157b7aa95ad0 [Sclerotinia trifoliorum]